LAARRFAPPDCWSWIRVGRDGSRGRRCGSSARSSWRSWRSRGALDLRARRRRGDDRL